jgi:hypothetical protein
MTWLSMGGALELVAMAGLQLVHCQVEIFPGTRSVGFLLLGLTPIR